MKALQKILLIVSALFSMAIGQNAPDFTAKDLTGKTHNLYTYLNQNKYVLIEFLVNW